MDGLVHVQNRIKASLIFDKAYLEAVRSISQKTDEKMLAIKKNEPGGPSVDWEVSLRQQDGSQHYYGADIELTWQEQARQIRLSRQFYVRAIQ